MSVCYEANGIAFRPQDHKDSKLRALTAAIAEVAGTVGAQVTEVDGDHRRTAYTVPAGSKIKVNVRKGYDVRTGRLVGYE